jgi:8-hydroxy-5-deazaflavin:NADPH oxidoreductase
MSEIDQSKRYSIAIIGGTGKEGKGLAYRWSKVGHKVIIGSRQVEKAITAADEIKQLTFGKGEIIGKTNQAAAREADIVVLTVPFTAHREMLESIYSELAGKILVDVTVPLIPPKVAKVQMPPSGSALQEARQILGTDIEVVSAFQNISYENLLEDAIFECDVLVCGTSKVAREIVIHLAEDIGFTAWDAGPVENSMVVEGLTSILIGINKQYGGRAAGIKITGVK